MSKQINSALFLKVHLKLGLEAKRNPMAVMGTALTTHGLINQSI